MKISKQRALILMAFGVGAGLLSGMFGLGGGIIIVPGLVFGIQIWWLYFLTLATSLTLIWASNEKLLPTLVGFNTIWVWLSCAVIVQNLVH